MKKQNGVELSAEMIIGQIVIDANNGIQFNQEIYLKQIKDLVEGRCEQQRGLCINTYLCSTARHKEDDIRNTSMPENK